MARDPMSKARSEWKLDVEWSARLAELAKVGTGLESDITAWTRNVGDGRLDAFVGTVPSRGLHLSIAHKRLGKGRGGVLEWSPGRYPTWDEIADARDTLLPPERVFVMVLPKPEDYVALHKTTFHLHEAQPDGVVQWADGTRWNVEVSQLQDGNVEVDPDGYPLARLTPYAAPATTSGPAAADAEGGEGDVTTPPDLDDPGPRGFERIDTDRPLREEPFAPPPAPG